MRLVFLGSRDIIIAKNNITWDFWINMEGLKNRIWYKK